MADSLPVTRKSRTIHAVYKLGSFPVPQNGRTVHTMDKITTQELRGAICQDTVDSSRGRALGTVSLRIVSNIESMINHIVVH